MKNRLINKILKEFGYIRKDLAINKLKEQKSEIIKLEEVIFELKCERQNMIMELEQRRRENELLKSSLEDERLERLAAEKSLVIAKEIMKGSNGLKKVFGKGGK